MFMNAVAGCLLPVAWRIPARLHAICMLCPPNLYAAPLKGAAPRKAWTSVHRHSIHIHTITCVYIYREKERKRKKCISFSEQFRPEPIPLFEVLMNFAVVLGYDIFCVHDAADPFQ